MAEMILARIQRCGHCGREMSVPPLEYQENPFCTVCLPERISAAMPHGKLTWRREGNYVIPEVSQTRPPSVRKRHQG
jgi:hypothetical protein